LRWLQKQDDDEGESRTAAASELYHLTFNL